MSQSSHAYRLAKRALDIVGASLLLIALSPLLVLIAIAIKLDSPGPVLYRGTRLGKGQRRFNVLKFRSMHDRVDDAPHREYVTKLLSGQNASGGGDMYKLVDDDRVTRVGRRLRRWSLDELPQLLNVLRGEMSLVGPRPEVPYALDHYESWQLQRFDVLPGLTGLWQVSGRATLTPREMLALDREYAERCTFGLDLTILARTIPAVARRVGSA